VKYVVVIACWLLSLGTFFLIPPNVCLDSIRADGGYECYLIFALIFLVISSVFYVRYFRNLKKIKREK